MMIDNRTRILQVALKLFAAHGYDGVGVQQIVEAAGVTKPTLYHYFNSKHGLFETLIAEKSVRLLKVATEATEYHGDLPLTLTRTVRAYFDYAQDEPTFYRLLLATTFSPPESEYHPPVAALQRQQFALFETLFQRAVEQHGNLRGRQQQYAVSLRGTIDTYIGLALMGHASLAGDEISYRVVQQFMYGIFS